MTVRVNISDTDQSFSCSEDDTFLRSALRAGVGFPYECNVGSCGSCKYELVEGDVETLWDGAPGLSPRDQDKGRHLGCQSRPLSDCVIKVRPDPTYAPHSRPEAREAELISVHELTPDMREFRFRADGDANFLPGQYAMLKLPSVTGLRAFSMSNTGNLGGEWHFMIKRLPGGKGTKVLFDDLKPGDKIRIDGPYGIAYLRTHIDRDIVCIAGGSGLSPMISITRGAAVTPSLADQKLQFFYGGRTPSDICGREFLEQIDGFGQRITYHAAVSEPGTEDGASWPGPGGFVHELVEQTLGEDLDRYEYYFAGPPPMIQATLTMLVIKYKVPMGQIHYDRFY